MQTNWDSVPNRNNIKAVAALTDTTQWTAYAEPGVANWAMGAPTLEMFVASYNKTHTKQIDCKVESSTGYKVGINTSGGAVTSFSTNITGLGAGELDNAIYCPTSGYWWLASPSARGSSYVMRVHSYDGGYLGGYDYNSRHGLRPLVSVPLSKIGNGLTITTRY